MTDPRKAALRRYAADHDRFAEDEQIFVGMGRYVEAEGAHAYAGRLVRAYKAETDDPEPEPSFCHICRHEDVCDTAYHLTVRIGL